MMGWCGVETEVAVSGCAPAPFRNQHAGGKTGIGADTVLVSVNVWRL
ncbi:MAG: hypothetical protein ACREBD_01730 [Blastocatellia bacterium]